MQETTAPVTASPPLDDPANAPNFAGTYHWPTSEYYVSPTRRLVYCPIQKVACSSLKLWWAEFELGASDDFTSVDHLGVKAVDHLTLDSRFKLTSQPVVADCDPLRDEGWFRFAFVRNPWARLVSTFVNKFVELHPLAQLVFDEVREHDGEPRTRPGAIERYIRSLPADPTWDNELTFRQFVDHLSRQDLEHGDADLHWRPQYRFLDDVAFDFIGHFERLAADMKQLAQKLDLACVLTNVNRTRYRPAWMNWQNYSDWPLRHLRRLRRAPAFRQFYDASLVSRVGQLYRQDVERFGYEFAA